MANQVLWQYHFRVALWQLPRPLRATRRIHSGRIRGTQADGRDETRSSAIAARALTGMRMILHSFWIEPGNDNFIKSKTTNCQFIIERFEKLFSYSPDYFVWKLSESVQLYSFSDMNRVDLKNCTSFSVSSSRWLISQKYEHVIRSSFDRARQSEAI